MKKKLLYGLTALLFAVCSVVGFVACSDDDEDDGITAGEIKSIIDDYLNAESVEISTTVSYADAVIERLPYGYSDYTKRYIIVIRGEYNSSMFSDIRSALYSLSKVSMMIELDFSSVTNLTSVSSSAFYDSDEGEGLSNLFAVTLPSTVTSIKSNAFYECENLRSVNGGAVTSIGSKAFYDCTRLESAGEWVVTSIGSYAFYNCSKLATGVDLGDGVISIGSYAFYYCTSLTSVDLGIGVETIGTYAFYHCTALTELTIPDMVTSIGSYAFYYCTSLTSVDLGNEVTSIGTYAFYHCTALTELTIPSSVTSIGYYAFYYCGLESDDVTFETTDGWYYYLSQSSSTSYSVDSSDLVSYLLNGYRLLQK